MIYKLLNREAKNWWYFRQLRQQGNDKEARKRERQSILNAVKTLRNAKRLELRGARWSIQQTNSWLTGYYNADNETHYEIIAERLGLPIIDTRNVDDLSVILSNDHLLDSDIEEYCAVMSQVNGFKFKNIKLKQLSLFGE